MENQAQKSPQSPWWQPGLMLFAELSGWIAVPVILGVFLGKWLDQRYNTKPWLFLITVFVAFIISMIGIVKTAGESIRQMEILNKQSKKYLSKNKDNDIKQ